MPFLILAYDHPDKEREREEVRADHRAYLASFGGRLLASGALLGEDGTTILGGASLLDTSSYEEAVRFEAEDPYVTKLPDWLSTAPLRTPVAAPPIRMPPKTTMAPAP